MTQRTAHHSLPKLLRFVGVAALFGVIWAAVKTAHGGDGVRYYAGNLSAPWLVLPTLAGYSLTVKSRRTLVNVLRGSVGSGFVALTSLGAFYATTGLVFHAVNNHTARNNLMFIVGGTLGAALFTGLILCVFRSQRAVALCLGIAVALEPLFSISYARLQDTMNSDVEAVAIAELTVGILLLLATRFMPAERQPPAQFRG